MESRPDPSDIFKQELTENYAEIARKEAELQMATAAYTKLEKDHNEFVWSL